MTQALDSIEEINTEEVGRIGEAIYRDCLRASVMPQYKGKFLVLDIKSRDYEIDDDDLTAWERLVERQPEGRFFGLKIGYVASYSMGGSIPEETE